MVSNSESFFQRTLDEKTREAREAVQNCVVAFLAASTNSRSTAATEAYESVGRIIEMLHQSDRPAWLTDLHSNLRVAVSNHGDANGIRSVQKIANSLQNSLNRHKWRLADMSAADGFDFDAVFNKYKNENRIPELFDEIINALTAIIESGEIDSVRALDELKRVVATLQNARNGSYFATRNAWFFVATWFKNTGWEMLGDIPVLGAAVRGLRQTLDDMNNGMQNLHDQIQADLTEQLSQDFPRLEYNPPEIPRLEHDPSLDEDKTT